MKIAISVRVRFNALKDKKERRDLFDKDFDSELYGIFKSIGRYFLKTQLKNHTHCIESFGRNAWWDRYTLKCKGKICVNANAYLLWRMYYESLDHPILLFKKFKGKTPDRSHIYWEPPSYRFPEAVLKRVFALECFWVFYECKLLAKEFNSKGVYSFNRVEHITNKFIPHWIVEEIAEETGRKLFNFYYWYQAFRLQQFLHSAETCEE